MKNLTCFLIFFCVCLTCSTMAQKRKKYITDAERFNAGVIIGFNTTQIDGDYFTGYDKYSLTGGIKGIVRLSPRLDFNMEFLYSKKGSKILSGNRLGTSLIKDRIIDLTYVDVPLLLKWMLEEEENSWHVEGGLVYARLINSKIEENLQDPIRDFSYLTIIQDFDKDEFSGMFGLGRTWKNGLGFHGRFVMGLTKFYQNEEYVAPPSFSTFSPRVDFLRNYYITVQLSYAIF